MKDRMLKGRTARGSKSASAKVTEDDVRLIRIDYQSGASIAELSFRFGLAHVEIRNILHGVTWSHTEGPIIPIQQYRKLTEEDVQGIRGCLREGMAASSIGRMYGVARTTVMDIKHGRTWKEVTQ